MKTDSTLIKEKPEVIEKGYNESDFGETYWTIPQPNGTPPRMQRNADPLICYVKDIFGIFNMDKNYTVIDIGAGAGNVVRDFRAAGFITNGCEFSASGRKIAEEKFGIELDYCDLREKLPYRNNEFDWAMAIGLLTMIPKRFLDNAIQEIFRVVRFGVIINIQSFNFEDQLQSHNLLHISGMTTKEWWRLLHANSIVDITSIIPQQKDRYKMATENEFAGLFIKKQNLIELMGV